MITTIIEDEAALLPGSTPLAAYATTPHKTIEELCAMATARAAAGEHHADIVQDIVNGYALGWQSANHRAIERAARTANVAPLLSASQRAVIEQIADAGRDAVIVAIRKALKVRSGKPWSVTGGRGTAWGWITVETPPARRTQRCRLKAGAVTNWPDDYEVYDSGEPGGGMLVGDAAELAALLGIEAHQCRQHWSIPAQRDFQRVALCRAMHGHAGGFTAEANWD
jgi:hypothetical protein